VNAVSPVPASKTLESFFLEARCRILDLAAILDRIQRGPGAASVDADPRVEKIRRAIEVLHDQSGGRAERIQQVFSIEYDSGWDKPKPRY
jgi:hypothetical protein